MNARQSDQNGGYGESGSESSGDQSSQSGQDSATNVAGTTWTTPVSTSSSSSNVNTALVGGIVGGIAFILLVSFIAIFLLQRRKKKQLAEKNGTLAPITFAGQTLHNRTSQHEMLIENTAYTGHDFGTGRESLSGRRDSGDYFLPTYAESQAGISTASTGRLNGSYRANVPSSDTVSPISMYSQAIFPQNTGSNPIISPILRQTTGISSPSPASINPYFQGFSSHGTLSPQGASRSTVTPYSTGFLAPQHTGQSGTWNGLPAMEEQSMDIASPLPSPMRPQTCDTMGFPETSMIIPMDETSTPVSIISPVPRHPRVHRAEIEMALREGTPDVTELPHIAELPTQNDQSIRARSAGGSERDSDVLGSLGQGPSVMRNNIERNVSQRTIDSESSMGIDMVSEAELERLGVGKGSMSHR